MNKKNPHIDWQILKKAISGKLTEQEQKALGIWLSASSNNQNYFNKAIEFHKREGKIQEFEFKPAFDQFLEQTSRNSVNYLQLFQVAASVILLIAFSWLGYELTNTEKYYSLSEVKPIKAKEGKVELVLSSGKSVLLSKQGEEVIKETQGEIRKKNGLVDYLGFKNTRQKYIQYNTVNVPRGSDFKLILSDSTIVWLNAESSITYPIQFAANSRNVRISGEVYFDVMRNTNQPFVVETHGTKVKILGTEFNINAYKEGDGIFTTLIEGSVVVGNQFGKTIVIKPNEQAMSNNSLDITVRKVDINHVIDWRYGKLDFEDEPLVDILEELARWYDLKIFYESDELKNFEFTGGIDRYEDLGKLLKLFEMTKSVQFYVKDDMLLVKKAVE